MCVGFELSFTMQPLVNGHASSAREREKNYLSKSVLDNVTDYARIIMCQGCYRDGIRAQITELVLRNLILKPPSSSQMNVIVKGIRGRG